MNAQQTSNIVIYNEENGLHNNEIYDITADDKGMLYISTSSGIESFDGKNFSLLPENELGLFNQHSVMVFNQKKLYCCSRNKICRFNGYSYDIIQESEKHNYFNNLILSRNGNIMAYNIEKTIHIQSVWFPLMHIDFKLPDTTTFSIKKLAFLPNGALVIATSLHTYIFNQSGCSILQANYTSDILVDYQRRLFYLVNSTHISAYDFQYLLKYTFSFREKNIYKTPNEIYYQKNESFYFNKHIYVHAPDITHMNHFTHLSNSDVEVNTNCVFDIDCSQLDNPSVTIHAIPENIGIVHKMYMHNADFFWFATNAGLYKIKNEQQLLKPITLNQNKIISAFNMHHKNYVIDDESRVYLFQHNQLTLHEPLTAAFQEIFRNDITNSNLIFTDYQQQLFIGTLDGGIWSIDQDYHVTNHSSNAQGFEKTSLTLCVANDTLYSSGYEKINVITKNKTEGFFISRPELNKKFVYAIMYKQQTFYVVCEDYVYMYKNLVSGNIIDSIYLPNAQISDLEFYDNQLVLSTVNNGLYFINFNQHHFNITEHITTKDGLSSNYISDIYKDNHNKLWLLTKNSIDVLEKKNSNEYIFNFADYPEFINNNDFERSLLIDTVTDYFFYTTTKLYAHHLSDFNITHQQPVNVNIVQIEADNIPVKFNKQYIYQQEKIYTGIPSQLVVDHNTNNIGIYFSAIQFNNKNIQYQYYLEGLEDSWSTLNKNAFTSYRNLKPGKYIFHVRSKLNGTYSPTMFYPITITPPWWQNRIVYLFECMFLIAGIVLIYRNQVKSVQNKYNKQLQEIDLHNKVLYLQSASLLNQLKPHFIFNALAPLQHYIYTSNKEKAIAYLHTFSVLIRNMLTYSRQEYISIEHEIEFIKQYLSQQQIEKDFSFDFTIENNASDYVQIPSLLIQPIIENCIQHGFSTHDKGNINIHFTLECSYVCITIRENGTGFNLATVVQQKPNHALSIIYEKIKLYQSNPDWSESFISHSIPGNSPFTITIKIPYK